MHSIYTTEAIILKSLNAREANRYFWLLTRDFGLVRASAQGIRLQKSKLRFSLTDYSIVNVSLVRGKEYWRITSAVEEIPVTSLLRESLDDLALVVRIYSLLLRLIHGEEKNDSLFETVYSAVKFLTEKPFGKDQVSRSSFECILALRILSKLGYIGELERFKTFLTGLDYNSELISNMLNEKTQAITEINRSLKATQL